MQFNYWNKQYLLPVDQQMSREGRKTANTGAILQLSLLTEGIFIARNQLTTCCVGGKDALCEILVESDDE